MDELNPKTGETIFLVVAMSRFESVMSSKNPERPSFPACIIVEHKGAG
jgi:hypothetical protein